MSINANVFLAVREVFHQIYVLDNDSPKKTVSLWSIMDLEYIDEQEFLWNWTARLSLSTGTTVNNGESHNMLLSYNTNKESCLMVRYYFRGIAELFARREKLIELFYFSSLQSLHETKGELD